jgi:CubicO group peptidase (beta-lactamase class C family)
VTKPWTATAVLQLHDQGIIDIDAPIAPYVDGILMRDNGTTMAQLWNNDPNISLITPRLLMGMRAGLQDYNDTWYKVMTEDDPTFDITP